MYKKRVIALGFFDGIHLGHAALLRKTLETSTEKSLTPSVITFDLHPQGIVYGNALPLINSPEDRADLIRRLFGIDDILFLHFDKETASMPWDRFIIHLTEEFHATHLVAGYDFRFGSGGNGNSRLLRQKCAELGVGCDIIPEVQHDGVTCSSTYIRELIQAGDVERASEFLGHPHVLTGVVHDGYHLGRQHETPVINMVFPEGVLTPTCGTYATKVFFHHGSINIDMVNASAPRYLSAGSGTQNMTAGSKPLHISAGSEYPHITTVSTAGYTGLTNIIAKQASSEIAQTTAETHIQCYSGNLYGQTVRIEFHKRLYP